MHVFIQYTTNELTSGLPVALQSTARHCLCVEILSNVAQQYHKLYLKLIALGD